LARLRDGRAAERVAEVLRGARFEALTDMQVACRAGVQPEEVAGLRRALRSAGELVEMAAGGAIVHRVALAEVAARAEDFLQQWHGKHPTQPGFPQDRWMNWLARRTAPEMARAARDHLLGTGRIVLRGAFVCHAAFAPALSGEDQKTLEALLARYEASAMCPPTISELKKEMGRAFARAERMIEQAEANGQLVRIDGELLLHGRRYEEMKETVRRLIESQGPVTLSAMREALGSTRKFVVPMAEHLDKIRFTRRRGDLRTLG
jgi:selenocysteine-specific elongation factor